MVRMSVRPYLVLRVVPASLGAHAAMAGSFTLMEFAEFKPVAYLESETSSLFLEKPEESAAYQRILGAGAGTGRTGGGTITGAGCRPGNRALRGSRGPT